MEDWEFVGPDVSFAHGIYFEDRELETLRAKRNRGLPLPLLQHAPG